jgi:Uma2 family endonuclease
MKDGLGERVVSRQSSVVRVVLCASVDMDLGVRQDWREDKEAPMSTTTRRYTYADLLETPDDGNRYEIIDGELIVSAAPLVIHQWFLYLLSRRFGDHVDREKLGRVLFAPIDVLFSTGDTVEPDLMFIRKDRLHIVSTAVVNGAPDILLEVLSPSTRDRDLGIKLALYESQGVPEYWIADPEIPELILFVLGGSGRYERINPEGGVLRSRVLPDFAIDLGGPFAELTAK